MIRRYFVACNRGLESAVAGELAALGAADLIETHGGVAWVGDQAIGYAANLWLRAAIRVQEQLIHAPIRDQDDLYELALEVPWERYLSVDQTLAVDASVRDSVIRHSGFAGLRVKDAVVDRLRKLTGRRPSVDTERPDLPIKLVLKKNMVTLYRDLSGTSLHKRGWRPVQVKSPLNEATAAGLLQLAGWDRQTPLVDPMCGSGTFVIEAALAAADRAPGMGRPFAFQRWPDFDADLWNEIVLEAQRRARPSAGVALMGNDRHAGALALAKRSADAAGVGQLVRFSVGPVATFTPYERPGAVFVNPPYGQRLGEGEDLIDTWRDLGAFLKRECVGAVAHVLSGNPELTRHLGMRASRRFPVRNGTIDCRLLRYEIEERGGSPQRDDEAAPAE